MVSLLIIPSENGVFEMVVLENLLALLQRKGDTEWSLKHCKILILISLQRHDLKISRVPWGLKVIAMELLFEATEISTEQEIIVKM